MSAHQGVQQGILSSWQLSSIGSGLDSSLNSPDAELGSPSIQMAFIHDELFLIKSLVCSAHVFHSIAPWWHSSRNLCLLCGIRYGSNTHSIATTADEYCSKHPELDCICGMMGEFDAVKQVAARFLYWWET